MDRQLFKGYSFPTHPHPDLPFRAVREAGVMIPLYKERTEVQREAVICPRTHSDTGCMGTQACLIYFPKSFPVAILSLI